jgi:L-fuconolactonase
VVVVDAHQHFWDPSRVSYSWLAPYYPELDRRIGFDDLAPHLRANGVDATVLVQSADSAEDNEAMWEIADQHAEIAGIVAWLPLDEPDRVGALLEQMSARGHLVGVRNLIHTRPDPDWVLRDDVSASLSALAAAHVPFDLVSVLPRHLEHVSAICESHPELAIVIDHLSKPPIAAGESEPWRALIARAARYPNVYAKVSGLYPSSNDRDPWTVEDLRPIVHFALEIFGAERLMFGSDWPICEVAGGYDVVAKALFSIFDELGPGERGAVLGNTAAAVYGLEFAPSMARL